MFEKAVEVLVQAALAGHRQILGLLHDRTALQGECVVGLFLLAFNKWNRDLALSCSAPDKYGEALRAYGFREIIDQCPECGIYEKRPGSLVIHWNDFHKWDFLTIARKLESLSS